jgi:hypothetical protein
MNYFAKQQLLADESSGLSVREDTLFSQEQYSQDARVPNVKIRAEFVFKTKEDEPSHSLRLGQKRTF